MGSPSWFERKGVVDYLGQMLAGREAPGYLVGGYVRDLLLERDSRDLDVVVSQDAIDLAREMANGLGGAFVLLDEERHTARVVLLDNGDRYYVDFATLQGGELAADLALRDFTINAMAIEVQQMGSELRVLDPCDGRRDLESGTLRAVSAEAFRNDAIRLLRGVRLAAELGFEVENHTEQLMVRDASLIEEVSAERVRDELCRILAAKRSEGSLRYLDHLGLLTLLLPELDPLRGLEQPAPHHEDAFEHSMSAVGAVDRIVDWTRDLASGDGLPVPSEGTVSGEAAVGQFGEAVGPFAKQTAAYLGEELVGERGRSVLLKLSALLHDVGKAGTAKVDDKERIHFYGHASEGAAIAARILRRQRFGKREVDLVRTTIRHHMRPLHLATLDTISRRAIYRFFRDTGGAGLDVLLLSVGDHLALVQDGEGVEQWERVCRAVGVLLSAYYEQYQRIVKPAPLLSGRDLIERLGLLPGPEVGELLLALQEAQAAGEVSTREQALQLVENLKSKRKG